MLRAVTVSTLSDCMDQACRLFWGVDTQQSVGSDNLQECYRIYVANADTINRTGGISPLRPECCKYKPGGCAPAAVPVSPSTPAITSGGIVPASVAQAQAGRGSVGLSFRGGILPAFQSPVFPFSNALRDGRQMGCGCRGARPDSSSGVLSGLPVWLLVAGAGALVLWGVRK